MKLSYCGTDAGQKMMPIDAFVAKPKPLVAGVKISDHKDVVAAI
jgi:hypothetical protein